MRLQHGKPHVSWLDRPFMIVLIIVLTLLLYIGSVFWLWHMVDMADDDSLPPVSITLDAVPKGTRAQ